MSIELGRLIMCGRFTLQNKESFKNKYGLELIPNYNITPASDVHILTDKISLMKWAYSPKWAKKSMDLFNARSETLSLRPSFKEAKKCVFIVDGWYEWKREDTKKIPYYHHFNKELFNIAGIYNDNGCAIVTREALGKLQKIHDRQPVLLTDSETERWLAGDAVFESRLTDKINIHEVSSYVNDPNNNKAECIEEVR